jgi:hypothetical protein
MSGEGFAFFRWHAINYPDTRCDGHPSCFCRTDWVRGRRS